MMARRMRRPQQQAGNSQAKHRVKVNYNRTSINPVTDKSLQSLFSQYGPCVLEFNDHGKGYARLYYSSLGEARKAAVATNRKSLNGHILTVVIQEDTSSYCAVKVSFLPKEVTEDVLEKIFALGEEVDLVSVKLNDVQQSPYNYAYVNYASYADAQQAVSKLDGVMIGGSKVRVKIHNKTSVSEALSPISSHPPYAMSMSMPMPPPGPLSPPGNMYTQPVHTPTNFSTLKVSIHGSLTSEDIEEVFSKFGTLRDKPIVRSGTPNYAYVNFEDQQNAQLAYQSLNNRIVKEAQISIRLQRGQKQQKLTVMPAVPSLANADPQASSSLLHDCRPVPCRPLVARLLTLPSSKFAEQLQAVCQSQKIVVKPMKSGNGVNLLGDKQNLSAAEVCIQLLIEKIESELDQETLALPCHCVPQFTNPDILKRINEIEEKHSVEVLVVNEKQQDDPRLFVNAVTSQISGKSRMTAPTVSSLSTYLSNSNSNSQPTSTTSTNPASRPDDVWRWEDFYDDGDYKLYTLDMCAKISKQFKLTPTGSFVCTIPTRLGTAVYNIDFVSMTQTNLTTNTVRSIVRTHGTAIPQWFYSDDQKKMVPYSSQDSAEIEAMRRSGMPSLLKISGRTYTFDFTRMRQINVKTKHERRIQTNAISSISTLSSKDLCVSFNVHGLPENLPQATADLKAELSKAVVKKKIPLPPSSDEPFCSNLLQITHQYFVSAEIVDGHIQLRGIQGYIETIELIIMKEIHAYEKRVLSQGTSAAATTVYPDHWEPQTEKIALKPVRKGTSEWSKVASHIQKTLPLSDISNIERIQNKWLWEKYSFSKQRMSEKNAGVVNEKELFHGTGRTPPEKIFKSEQGFDFRFASSGMWGTGTYFAVNASYSHRYAYTNGTVKQMILAKVLTGETYRCAPDGSLKKPPVKTLSSKLSQLRLTTLLSPSDFEDELYDSVSGNAHSSDIFVIYDHEKAYPAYLITFR